MKLTSPSFVLRQLIRCRSVTPDHGGCFDVLQTMAAELGFTSERPRFSAEGTPTIENFYAKRQDSALSAAEKGKAGKRKTAKHLLFAGHIDVVPAGEAALWRFPPFDGEIADGLLYGRGAVDMKGGIACFIAALARIAAEQKPLGGAVSLLLTGDEEGPAINGTEKLLHWAAQKGEKWDAALLGEPSSAEYVGDMIKIGRRGSLSGIVSVIGKQGHVAYPHLAANPLPVLLQLAQALIAAPLDSGNADFQPSNLELTSLDTANKTANIIPHKAELRFNIRFNNCRTLAGLKAEIAERLHKTAQTYAPPLIAPSKHINTPALSAHSQPHSADISYKLEWLSPSSSPFLTHDAALIKNLSAAVCAVTKKKPQLSTGGGTSDARFIKNYCPVAECGLAGKTMHQINECVSIEDLEKLTQIYRRFIQCFFAA